MEICLIFKNHGLKIKIECNKKVVNYLDVTFDLIKGEHRPCRKENNTHWWPQSRGVTDAAPPPGAGTVGVKGGFYDYFRFIFTPAQNNSQ